jgi:hypothetical protein
MRSTWDILADDIRTAWRDRGDSDRGLDLAASVQELLVEGVDLAEAFPAVRYAAECLWDNDRTDEACALTRTYHERVTTAVASDEQSWWVPLQAHVQSARAWHRAGDPLAALGYAVEARQLILAHCGGAEEYRAHLELGPDSPICDEICSVLSIAIPAARDAARMCPDEVVRKKRQLVISEALRLTVSGHRAPSSDNAYALVNQLLLAVLARGRDEDAPLLVRLVGLDAMLRPTDARSQATRRLVDMALARWKGDAEGERRIAQLAARDLVEAGLRRHVRMLGEREHWPYDPSGERRTAT